MQFDKNGQLINIGEKIKVNINKRNTTNIDTNIKIIDWTEVLS